jgi:hypothetical protein
MTDDWRRLRDAVAFSVVYDAQIDCATVHLESDAAMPHRAF